MANTLKRPRGKATSDSQSTKNQTSIDVEPIPKKAKVEANRSLFVRSLPADASNESLANLFSQHFPVKHATVVIDPATKASRGFGFVTFADAEDAVEAKNKLNNELWNGRRITIDFAEARHRDDHGPAEKRKPALVSSMGKLSKAQAIEDAWVSPKLIIRNLPWSIKTSAHLAALFQSFGKLKFVDLPMKQGRLRGFGFVTIRGQKNAENAINAVNGKVVDGRTLAVDWAVNKEEWEKQHKEEEHVSTKTASESSVDKSRNRPNASRPDKQGDDSEEQLKADLENFMDTHMGNLEEESDSSDEDDVDEDEDSDPEDGSDPDDEEEGDDHERKEQRGAADNDRLNNSTVFVRNLPFTATDEQLKAHFLRFGAVRYARVVIDRATDRPAGTGFVCFVDEEYTSACIKNAPRPQQSLLAGKQSILQDDRADPSGKYTMDGRVLQVAQAVSKDNADRLAANAGAKRRAGDKRRLFLLDEGQLDTRSPLYQSLSQPEIQMREQSRSQRKKLVERNPTLHISLTRLAVRNIPHNLTSKGLKQLAREACVGFAKDVHEGLRQPLSKEEKARASSETKEAEHNRKLKRKGIVNQAKIVFESRDGSKVTESTGGKSRGYGFIEYSSHRWALMGLRWLNGHQMTNEQDRKQRLIVEFAIDNAQVVTRRKATEGPKTSARIEQEDEEPEQSRATSNFARKTSTPKNGPKKSSQKSSKKFAFKTGKGKGEANPSDSQDKTGLGDENADMKQKLIARKRLMRKKKAQSRKAA